MTSPLDPRRPRALARTHRLTAGRTRFILAFGLLVALAAAASLAHGAERGVTFGAPSGNSGSYGGYGGGWSGGGQGGQGFPPGPPPGPPGVYVQPYVNVPLGPQQTPMPPGAPLIPADQIQALVSGAGYAQVSTPEFSQGYYYVQATSAEGQVLLAVDAHSGQVVSSRPVASTPRPPVVESGSLIGNGSLIGTPPPTVPRGPLAPDPNNPDGE